MIVTCAICGFDGHIFDYEHWIRHGAKMPKVFICDICALEVRE